MDYQLVSKINMAHINKASELLSKVDLKPFSLMIGTAMNGQLDVTEQIFKNGILADTVQQALGILAKENLLCEFASIILHENKTEFGSYEDWDEERERIAKKLVFEEASEVISLVGKFLSENTTLKKTFKNFFQVGETVEEFQSTS